MACSGESFRDDDPPPRFIAKRVSNFSISFQWRLPARLETDERSDTIVTFKVQRTIALLERCFLLGVELALESPEYWLSDSRALKVRGPSCA